MISLEDVQQYLPKYLSPDAQKNLFDGLSQFPDNIDSRLYASSKSNESIIYQGDGLNSLLFINLPDQRIAEIPVMVLSNTCDVDPSNDRLFPTNVIYAPIIKLSKYIGLLEQDNSGKQAIDDHIASIKKQRITQIYYLPKGGSLKDESIVFLDKINSCNIQYLNDKSIKDITLFTLSDYGLYLFIFKLSLHFTRIQEGIKRGSR